MLLYQPRTKIHYKSQGLLMTNLVKGDKLNSLGKLAAVD